MWFLFLLWLGVGGAFIGPPPDTWGARYNSTDIITVLEQGQQPEFPGYPSLGDQLAVHGHFGNDTRQDLVAVFTATSCPGASLVAAYLLAPVAAMNESTRLGSEDITVSAYSYDLNRTAGNATWPPSGGVDLFTICPLQNRFTSIPLPPSDLGALETVLQASGTVSLVFRCAGATCCCAQLDDPDRRVVLDSTQLFLIVRWSQACG